MTARPLKGSAAVKAWDTILKSEGYTTHVARAVLVNYSPGKFFTQSNDIWNAVDVVSVHPQRGFAFDQVTTISGQSGNLDYGHVGDRKKKLDALPWPPQMAVHQTGDGTGIFPWYLVRVIGARNQKVGRLAARWFQVWSLDVDRKVWTLSPNRVHVSGPQVR